jgi:hypothetical protein
MSRKDDYVKVDDMEFALQLVKFAVAINGALGDKYHFSLEDKEEATKDADYTYYIASIYSQTQDYAKAHTSKKEENRYGTGTTASDFHDGPDTSLAPEKVLPGAEHRFREKAQRMKSQKSIFSDGDGNTAGILKTEHEFNPSKGQPDLKITFDGGHPVLKIVMGDYHGFEIWKNCNDGRGFLLLDKAFESEYTDMSKLPQAKVSAAWTYIVIYLFHDKRAGEWSKEDTITVLGYKNDPPEEKAEEKKAE